MSGFQPGDVVVCVVDTSTIPGEEPWDPIEGGVYRVIGAGDNHHGLPWIDLFEDPFVSDDSGWPAEWFRKIERATDAFTAQMRACKPIRTQVQA
jgi:hypothetical protein